MRFARTLASLAPPALLWTSIVRAQTSPVELIRQESPPANERISYGADALQFGELRLPAGSGPFPVAVLVHGGCWSATLGKLPDNVVSFELLRPIAAALAEAGIASWNVEYRRLGNEGGGWPGTFQDLAAATDRLRELARKYPLDLKRVAAVGHSSGGQLALWLAARPRLPAGSAVRGGAPLPLSGAVSVDGPPDLAAARAIEERVCGSPAITRFVGGTPAEFPLRYREGSSGGLLPLGVPQELLVASRAPQDWTELFRQYAASAGKAGDRVRIVTMEGANHFDGINPRAPAWTTVMESIRSVLRLP